MSQYVTRLRSTYRPEIRPALTLTIGVLVLALCCLSAALAYVLWNARPQPVPPTPSAIPTLPATPGSGDLTWDRIQGRGKIVVGVSADNPPFAFVGSNFSLQGYDIALAREIGRRMGLPVELSNMAFDGLLNAVQLGQIDMALASISASAERRQVVDFTTTYYAGEDSVLVNTGAPIPVVRLVDLAAHRVGVQKGSIYESRLQSELVVPGLMPPGNLVTFDTVPQTIGALGTLSPSVRAIMIDRIPALAAIPGRPLMEAAHGLYPQAFAAAVPKNSPTFLTLLNIVIGQMERDGTLDRLAQEHLNLDPAPIPTPTMIPPVPPTPAPTLPPPPCLDGMAFVADINFPDNNMTTASIVTPGQIINKGWRIRNTGTCTWNSNYRLVYAGANPPNAPVGGSPTAIQGVVPPGAVADVYAAFTAPAQPGRYQSFWMMQNPSGQTFGNRLWALIQVVSQVTPTPGPNAPVIQSFTATPPQLQAGQCVNLQWQYSGQNLRLVRLFRNGELFNQDMPPNGSYIDCPTQTGMVEYRLVIDAQSGLSTSASLMVSVAGSVVPTPTNPASQIQVFRADRVEIPQGSCVTLEWRFTGAMQGTIFRNEVPIASAPPSGGLWECPPNWGTFVYRLQAGASTSSLQITVLQMLP